MRKKSKMVEQPVMVEGGGGKMMLNSSSAAISSLPLQARPSDYRGYPLPLATHEEVVASPTLFRETLEKLHAAMGTKFMIPTVGGQDLDLHRLFVEVTSRGGITKILQDRKWKEIIGAFSFPSSATNASFILRKYYFSLLHHYEQIYFLKAEGWSPAARDALQFSSSKVSPHGHFEPAHSSSITKASTQKESTTFMPEASPAAATGSEVFGVIDGKFESGYLVTVKIGSEEFRGVLYQSAPNPSDQVTEHQSNQQCLDTSVDKTNSSAAAVGVGRRKRRKKSEMKKRDPAHPKPNRSGYNFFFADQHARLKPLHLGKDRGISRMIGDSWNKLKDSERAIYQEKAQRDKERYRMEMEIYRERLRTGQVISSALAIQQQPLDPHSSLAVNVDLKLEIEDATLSHSPENLISPNKNDMSNIELSVGQTIAYGDAKQPQTLGPDLNLMNLDMTLEDAPDCSGNDARQGDERNLEDHPIIELSVGQTIAYGDATQLQTLRPDLNLMNLDKTLEDAADCSGNDARRGDERNLEDHPIIEKGGAIEVSCGRDSGQGNASRKTQANEAVFAALKRAHMDGNEDKTSSGDAAAQNDK